MKKSLKFLLLTSALTVTSFFPVQAQQVELDRVSAIVNGGVVLESEIKDLIATIKKQALKNDQSLPSDKALRTQVTEKLINDALITQLGERMGVQVSDAQLDETLTNMAKEEKLTLDQFRQNLVKDGTDYDKYRELVRTELISGEVRRNSVSRRIYVSPQDVANLISSMEEKINTDVEYRLGHILIEFPANPTQDDMNAAKVRAEKVIELLNNGSDFAKIAIASSGGSNALEGGDLGWKNINELPTLFSSIVDGEKKESILGPIRTGLGFSIVKIIDIRGLQIVEVEEVKARHILIEPSVILSEAKAESILLGLMDRVNAGEADFGDLAKEYSDGPTSVRGGDLGWSDPDVYDPTFKAALARLKVDEMHKPFRTSFGWHLAQLTGRRTLDATEQMNESKARRILFNRKFGLESARWIKELRDEAYVEIFSRDTK
ncbi:MULTISPECIES: peptidylprolyl isomerase SurA [unclassified Colwellia]|jgi:peptidyl-prolyl cis-trans isomerase SurA|uniref:peptidylprolyl isomerase SurA n=1 Tax=unclassified Colwellia TaxID=196834 RepID=UPI0015F75DFF|nr:MULTISPECIES: peptidylprolyl isomerase SurA [unclassified Colwellia]MBA6363182.1 peptidylprolyl isomerase SurA [Colwellia sp. BRX8-8]MBA6336865.1 peptidylprolyl isomerase SurA [Colwellia sp. BRX8-7]MBA6348264.1 peptidylprolyl isomerase SurA [Colwellia sp. BRX8-9]MBA6351448.1 peptidylprolyl isomerase SurA [Colwellia sp. BRX9-1]MBA6354679.1 peptidylprolyl isomerase SurA [Colwellia sp. BRX8-3]